MKHYRNNAAMHDMNELKPPKTKVVNNTHDLTTLEIVGYLAGDEVVQSPRLMWKHFDWVQHFKTSYNVKKNTRYEIFLAWRNDATTLLITRRK